MKNNEARSKTIKTLSMLGEAMVLWGKDRPKDDFNKFIAEPYYDRMNTIIQSEKHHNGWFTESSIRESLLNLGKQLTVEQLEDWTSEYDFRNAQKPVGLIMAGNIPLVGFHDFLTTLLSGHKPVIKLSSDDKHLLPVLLDVVISLQPELSDVMQIVDRVKDVDAVIATGSNNSARYFEKYFGHLPNIIRKNRSSIAILNGDEDKSELRELGEDIFTYFGLGCRNISHLMIPEDFDMDRFFGAIVDYGDIINHNKYANNYDYYKAIYLMNQEEIIENGFLLTRESDELFAPIAVLHYQRYKNDKDVKAFIENHQEEIQAVVGRDYLPFGKAQSPGLKDYADGVDTMAFLAAL